jgi:histidinol-phosphatase (PHP family)
MSSPVLYESHMHTPLCKHAVGSPSEYAAHAEKRGLKGIIVTCHNPIPYGYSANVRMAMAEFDLYVDLVEKTRQKWEGRIDVRLGLECDYFPGAEPWLEKLHAKADFHHILGSVHPQVGEYQKRFFDGDPFEYQKIYFSHLAESAETGLFDTLSHPDLIKNVSPSDWDKDRILDHVCAALDRIAKTGVSMEINTSGCQKVIPEMNPGAWILKEMHRRDIPVVIGADAHVPTRVADKYLEALTILEGSGYDKIGFFLNRKRIEISITQARKSLILST